MAGSTFGSRNSQNDRDMAFAARPRGLDPAGIAAHVDLGPREADVERQVDDRGGDDDVFDAIAQRGDHRHREHEQRECHEHVDEAPDRAVEPATDIAAEAADHRADNEGQADGGERNGEIQAGGDDDAASTSRPSWSVPAQCAADGALQRVRDVGGDGIVGRRCRGRRARSGREASPGGGEGGHRIAAQHPGSVPEGVRSDWGHSDRGRAHSTETLGSAMP